MADIENSIKHVEVGQKVVLKLAVDIVVGELLLKKLPSHLRLKNCRDYTTNENLGTNIYYINEIRDIRVWNDEKTKKEVVSDASLKVEKEDKKTQKNVSINIRDDKLNKIREMLNTRLYIDRYDHKYFSACKDMMNQRQIGVCFKDVSYGRKSTVGILAVSTDKSIYIFDLLLLDGINKELKAVFEAKSVCKIIHYSKMTYDYLKHACKIKTNFIFDTLMAYFYVSDTREVISVTELISKLFNLPHIEPAGNVTWNLRPISAEVLNQSAFAVGFLIEIQQFLMHRHLLRSFYDASATAMCQLSNNDEFPYAIKPVNGKEKIKDLVVDKTQNDPVDLKEIPYVHVESDDEKEDTAKDSEDSSTLTASQGS